MKITWNDIKQSVNRLMFLDPSEIDEGYNSLEYKDAVIEAANFALIELSKIFPVLCCYDEISQSESDEDGYNTYDMFELVDDFAGFSDDAPVLISDDELGWVDCPDYQILLDRYLYIKKSIDGDFNIIYKKALTKITSATDDDSEMELNAEVCNIMPLLIAYRVYKDDDPYKAAQYFNEYMNARAETAEIKTIKHRATVSGGDSYALSNFCT
ncbi:MAG: hypothetical protein AAGU14_02655 [Eubacteriaceae bacterium]